MKSVNHKLAALDLTGSKIIKKADMKHIAAADRKSSTYVTRIGGEMGMCPLNMQLWPRVWA